MKKRNSVSLTNNERDHLNKLLSKGNTPVKQHKIAQIILRLDISSKEKKRSDEAIGKEVKVSHSTITRIKKKFVEGRLEEVFRKKFTPRYSRRKLDGEGEAKLIATCCGEAPEGRARWTLQLLADKIVQLEIVDSISEDTIGRTLKKTNLSLGKKKNGASLQNQMRSSSAKWKMY